MAEGADSELAGQGDGAVGAGVVDQDHVVNDVVRDLVASLFQRLFRLIGGKNYGDFLAIEHRYQRGCFRCWGGSCTAGPLRGIKGWQCNCHPNASIVLPLSIGISGADFGDGNRAVLTVF